MTYLYKMKYALLFIICLGLFGCKKDNDLVFRQGIDLSFNKDYSTEGGNKWNKPVNVKVVLIWKSENRDLTFNGVDALDKTSNTVIAPDFTYSDIHSQLIELPTGKFFIAYVTGANEDPKLSYSYTNFSLQVGEFKIFKKNITALVANSNNAW